MTTRLKDDIRELNQRGPDVGLGPFGERIIALDVQIVEHLGDSRGMMAICQTCGTARYVRPTSERQTTLWCGDWRCRCERTHQVG